MLRRNFIKLSATGFAAVMYSRLTYAAGNGNSLINHPDEAWAQVDDQWVKLTGKGGSVFIYRDIKVEVKANGNTQAVYVQSPVAELQAVKFKWKYQTSGYSKVLGDHWERTYGDVAWNIDRTWSMTLGARIARNDQDYSVFINEALNSAATSDDKSNTYLATLRYAIDRTSTR